MEAPKFFQCACHSRRTHHLVCGESKPAFQEEQIGLCESSSQDCASTNRAEAEKNQANATLGVFYGGDSSKEYSSCAGPQTLRAEATNHTWTLGNGALPPFSFPWFCDKVCPKASPLVTSGGCDHTAEDALRGHKSCTCVPLLRPDV